MKGAKRVYRKRPTVLWLSSYLGPALPLPSDKLYPLHRGKKESAKVARRTDRDSTHGGGDAGPEKDDRIQERNSGPMD
jgi:hypothetical protein